MTKRIRLSILTPSSNTALEPLASALLGDLYRNGSPTRAHLGTAG
jgi:hypothetical protein